jgi:hypothetical protein
MVKQLMRTGHDKPTSNYKREGRKEEYQEVHVVHINVFAVIQFPHNFHVTGMVSSQ